MNVESNIEQVLVTTPHEAPTVRLLPPITKTIQVRRARHAGHCWRNKDELVSDVLLWTPTYGQAKAGRPARTYIQQVCKDTGCNPEDLPEAMNDREKWREMARDIRASDTTWWWWWWHRNIGKDATPFPGLLHFILDQYFKVLSVEQGGIKYHFFESLWYDSTWDWNLVSRTFGKH